MPLFTVLFFCAMIILYISYKIVASRSPRILLFLKETDLVFTMDLLDVLSLKSDIWLSITTPTTKTFKSGEKVCVMINSLENIQNIFSLIEEVRLSNGKLFIFFDKGIFLGLTNDLLDSIIENCDSVKTITQRSNNIKIEKYEHRAQEEYRILFSHDNGLTSYQPVGRENWRVFT